MITIRVATHNDIPTIRNLALVIWPPTYSSILSVDQLNYMLDLMYSEQSLAQQMQTNTFILALDENTPGGFASYGQIENNIYKLHKLYVLTSQQGKGTGRTMIEWIMKDLKTKNASALRLNVNRNNNAKVFYEKLGFSIIDSEDIDIGNGFFMNDYVMEKQISTIWDLKLLLLAFTFDLLT